MVYLPGWPFLVRPGEFGADRRDAGEDGDVSAGKRRLHILAVKDRPSRGEKAEVKPVRIRDKRDRYLTGIDPDGPEA